MIHSRSPSVCTPALVLALILAGCGSGMSSGNSTTSSTGSGSGSGGGSGSGSGSGSTGTGAGSGSSSAAEYLYSSAYTEGGNIYGFQIDTSTGKLTALKGSPFKEDAGPQAGCTVGCYLGLVSDPLGRFLYYSPSSPNVGSMNVDAGTGTLTEIGNASPGVSYLSADPTGKFLYGNSGGNGTGGSSNEIIGWSVSGGGSLSSTPGSPYGFPGDHSYGNPAVSNNFVFASSSSGAGSSMMYGFTIDPNTGTLTQVSSTDDGLQGALQVITPSGKFLYSEANYLNGTTYDLEIIGFEINADGTLMPINMQPEQTTDQIVTTLVISPNGKFLYELGGSALRIYSIDPNTGALTPQATNTNFHVGNMIAFDPASKYAYASPSTSPQNNVGSDQIQGYSVNQATGDLTPITGATATLPNSPQSIAIVSPR